MFYLMKRIIISFVIAIIAFSSLLVAPSSAQASATATEVVVTCSSVTAKGKTTSGFLGIQAANPSIGTVFRGFAATKIPFTNLQIALGTITFPTQPEGTLIQVNVYGATSTAGFWDNEADYRQSFTCHDIPAPTFTDGRLNQDAGQTAAVYCSAGGVNVLAIQGGKGVPAFNVSPAEIAEARRQHETYKALYLHSLVTIFSQISSRENSIANKQREIDDLHPDHPLDASYSVVKRYMQGQGIKDKYINPITELAFIKDRSNELKGEIRALQSEIENYKQQAAELTSPKDVVIKRSNGVTLWLSDADGSLFITGPSLDPTKPQEIYKFKFSC